MVERGRGYESSGLIELGTNPPSSEGRRLEGGLKDGVGTLQENPTDGRGREKPLQPSTGPTVSSSLGEGGDSSQGGAVSPTTKRALEVWGSKDLCKPVY